MKRFFKSVLVRILGWQVRRLQQKNDFSVVAVTGSLGKTSTKRAIAQYLSADYRVQYQTGNYNDLLSVPFTFFGLSLPALYNPFAWAIALARIERQVWKTYPYDVVVLELGTDGPGQIEQFAQYLHPDVAVITAITEEHMEGFYTLEAVATEELAVAAFSHHVVINSDDVPKEYAKQIDKYHSYGTDERATVQASSTDQRVSIRSGNKTLHTDTVLVGSHMHKTLAAACLVGQVLEKPIKNPQQALGAITAMPGRMRIFEGAHQTTIIDDTYNASPDAVVAALDVLYGMEASRRIAVLGNMNEMGSHAQETHERVGRYCDAEMLEEVLVIGPEAKRFLAPAAEAAGNNVHTFDSPYAIAHHLKKRLGKGTIILCKGSQNGVFLEEAIKPILKRPEDVNKLVRQSKDWLKKKHRQFAP